MKKFYWNLNVRNIKEHAAIDSVLWVGDNDTDQTPDYYSSGYDPNAIGDGATRLGTAEELQSQFKNALATSEELQQWLEPWHRETVLVIAEVDDTGKTTYTFHANARIGSKFQLPLKESER